MIDFGPHQNPITEDRIREMVNWEPRRIKLASDEWREVLHQPREKDQNWSLFLPFPETLKNAFKTMCVDVAHYAHTTEENRCCIFLNSSQDDEGESVRKAKAWIQTVGEYIAIRDCLALSYALDYTFVTQGGIQGGRTEVGDLCRRAKLYEGDRSYDLRAADQLAERLVSFLREMDCYDSADCVVAMPSSLPKKTFDLPRYLAGKIASATEKENLCEGVRTVKQRKRLGKLPVDEKLNALKGTVHADGKEFTGKTVLIVDDLYQSGTSLNYVAMLLLAAGAKKVFGLACEKTLTNDDNIV